MPTRLKGGINLCLDSLRFDQISLLYWADLAGWTPEDVYDPMNYRKPTGFARLTRQWHGIARQLTKGSVEHMTGLALKLYDVDSCGWCSVMMEAEARKTLLAHWAELPNYFQEKSHLRDCIFRRGSLLHDEFDVVIGHSMGSIILIDLMQQGVFRTKDLVTIGSPLGMGVIQHAMRRWYPARIPLRDAYSGEWLNVSDPLDIVSMDSTLDGEYPGCKVRDVSIENDALTPTGKPHYHSLYGYLRCDPVQELIRRHQ